MPQVSTSGPRIPACLAFALGALSVAGCGGGGDGRAPDAGPADTGPVDAGPVDTGPADTGRPDATPPPPVDAGPVECAEPPAAWAALFVGTANQQALAGAADPSGAVVLAGRNQGVVDFGAGPRDAGSFHGVFVLKLGADGELVFDRHFVDAGDDSEPKGVAVDADGAVFVTGYVKGEIDLGAGVLAPTVGPTLRELFVLKLSSAGETVWARRFGMGTGWAVAPDGAGGVVVTGELNGTQDLGGGSVTANGQGDAFLLHLDADGAHVRSALFGGARLDSAYGVAVGPDGDVAVTGQSYGELDFGDGTPIGTLGTNHLFVARLRADLSPVHVAVSAGNSASGHVVGFAPDGGLVIQGDGRGEVDLGGGPLDRFVAKLDEAGHFVWSAPVQGPGLARAFGFDDAGVVWVPGALDPTTAGCPAPAAGRAVVVTGLLVADGSFRGSRSAAGSPTLWSVGVAGDGSLLVAGWASGAGVDLGTGPLPASNANDVIAARYAR